MKKFLKVIFILALIIISLMFLVKKLDILDFSDYKEISKEDLERYSNYYFDKLDETEKRIYIKIDKSLGKEKTSINFTNVDEENVNESVERALTAFVNDNPEIFYLSNSYILTTKKIIEFKFYTLTIQYNYSGSINEGKEQLNNAIKGFLKGIINNNMSDYEKELAIHDKLVEKVKYYDYKDIENIPSIKHSSYGVLVDNEGVCDGYSKAFKILLKKVGIESIVVTGELEGVPHAWNIVKIGNKYYHVDITSDDGIDKDSKNHVIHAYFNLKDSDIVKTHKIGESFKVPKCESDKYNYYNYNGLIIKTYDDINNKLKKITSFNKTNNILEFKVDPNISSQTIIDYLYGMDFNLWKTKGVTNITYNKINDIFIFKK